MELSLLHKTVMLIGTVLFHALDLAVKAHGEIKEQRSILNKSRSSYHNGVIGALQGIYIADVDFEFNEGISEYTLKTDECIRHLEIFFQVPMWMKPETMDYNGVVKEPEDCFVDRRIKPIVGELHTTGPMPQLGNVTEHYDYNDVHKADVTNHGAIGCIGKTPTSDDKIQGDLKRAKVGISVNGQTVDDRDAGYVKLPVHCGMKNTVNIDVRVSDTNNDKLIQYKLDIQVPPKGAKNFLATLEVLGRDGTLEKLEPTLSLAFRTHIVVIKHKEDVTFGVYAECQHGMPTIDDVPGCEANVTLKHNTRKIELVVKCEAFTPTNGKYVVEATIYTLRLERLTADGVPPPRKVISIMETNQCDITLNGENNATNITCIKRSRNFSPLIIETDSDYLYVMQAKHAVDGQVEEIHPLKEDYIQIRNETITPVLDLNSDILIHGFGRNKVETFVISNKSEETSGALYHSILAALIIDAYLCALVTHLLPGIIRGHMGVMFDHVPKIGEPMMYLVQIICAYADERISKVCEHFTMLPNVSNSETDYIQLLGKFYIYAAAFAVIIVLISTSKKKSEQLVMDDDENIQKYVPLNVIISIFAFPWTFLAGLSVIKPFFGTYEEPKLDFYFINTNKLKTVPLTASVSWVDCLRVYATIPMAIIGVITVILIYRRLLRQIKTTWADIRNKDLLWVRESDTPNCAPFTYSYYEEQEAEQIDAYMEALHMDNDKGFWTCRKCNVLSTQFISTFTSHLPFSKRRHAIVAAYISLVDLDERYEALGNDKNYMQLQNYDPLDETATSLELDVPEVVDVYPADDAVSPPSGIQPSRPIDRDHRVAKQSCNTTTGLPVGKDFIGETSVYVQVDYLKRINRAFETRTIATVDARFLTYFITYRFIKNAYSLNHDLGFNEVIKMRTCIQVKVNQLFTMDDSNHMELDRNVHSLLLHKLYVLSKSVNGLLAAAALVVGQRTANWLRYLQIISHLLVSLMLIVERPYDNLLDNWFSFVCINIGLYYMLYTKVEHVTTQPYIWLSIVVVALVAYATTVSLMFLVDLVTVFWISERELNHQANVRVVVKNQNTNVVDVIYGKCNQTVSMQCVTFNKEHVTIGESYGNNKIPTIAVALEHIDSASCYLPFITISYISDVRDTFVINRSQANKPFLKRYFSAKFNKKIAHSLARKIIEHVEYNTHNSSFCFEIPI